MPFAFLPQSLFAFVGIPSCDGGELRGSLSWEAVRQPRPQGQADSSSVRLPVCEVPENDYLDAEAIAEAA